MISTASGKHCFCSKTTTKLWAKKEAGGAGYYIAYLTTWVHRPVGRRKYEYSLYTSTGGGKKRAGQVARHALYVTLNLHHFQSLQSSLREVDCAAWVSPYSPVPVLHHKRLHLAPRVQHVRRHLFRPSLTMCQHLRDPRLAEPESPLPLVAQRIRS